MTPAVESLLGVKPSEEDELGKPPNYHDLSLPSTNIFPADFQYLNQHNRGLIKDEVVSYIDKNLLGPEERDEVMAKYDTFRIEAACRRTLKELLAGFQT